MENDIAIIYENVARFAFNNCAKYGDPWKIAAQEVHNVFCDVNRNTEAKQNLHKIFVGLILKTKSEIANKNLLKLETLINNCKSQNDFNQLILKANKIIS